jgi:hypothetical protein
MIPTLLAFATLPLWNGLVAVQDGISKGGLHWHQTARADHGQVIFGLAFPKPDADDGGFGQSPLSSRAPLNGSHGEDFGPADESEVDGFVYRTVATVRVETATRTVILHPRPAPARALRRWPDLSKVRFYVHFFARGDTPRTVSALRADGKVLATESYD